MEPSHFWRCIRNIAQLDRSRTVPDDLVDRGASIFPAARGKSRVFRVKPPDGAQLRAGETTGGTKQVFEYRKDRFVELESCREANGFRLWGYASGMEEAPVRLFGEEIVFGSAIRAGEFEFQAVPPGWYTLAFDHQGESLWIPKLDLRESTGAARS